MENFFEILENILTIVGAISIIISLIKIFYNKKYCDSSVVIYSIDNEEEVMNKYRYVKDIDLKGKIKTVIAPNCCSLSSIKVYDVKFNENGKLKKNNLIYEEKNILANSAYILYADYSCGMPNTIVQIKNTYGGIFDLYLYENGFNGNNDYLNGVEWKYSLLTRIFNSIFR